MNVDTPKDYLSKYASQHKGNLVWAFLLLVVLVILIDGWYRVDKDQEATVKRFGAYTITTGPGLHFKLPLYDEVTKTSVTTVNRIEIGFRSVKADDDSMQYQSVPEESEMLTSDDNIAKVEFVVQYMSNDAAKWQFTVADPEQTLNLMAQSAMRLIVGRSPFDKIATVGKSEVQDLVQEILQGYVDKIDMGVQIVGVQLQDVDPPGPVVAAFKDVVTAREEKATMIQDARRYANKVVPEARGKAAEVINMSIAYASERIEAATGDVARFEEVLAKYQAAPEVTAQRLRFETQELVLQGAHIVVDPSDSGLLKFLNLTGEKALPLAAQ